MPCPKREKVALDRQALQVGVVEPGLQPHHLALKLIP